MRGRFGGSITTLPIWARVLVSVPVLLPLAWAALNLTLEGFLVMSIPLGSLVMLAALWLRHVWRSSDHWVKDRARGHRLERELARGLAQDADLESAPSPIPGDTGDRQRTAS